MFLSAKKKNNRENAVIYLHEYVLESTWLIENSVTVILSQNRGAKQNTKHYSALFTFEFWIAREKIIQYNSKMLSCSNMLKSFHRPQIFGVDGWQTTEGKKRVAASAFRILDYGQCI